MNIETELRKAFQAGQQFGAVVYGEAQTLNDDRPLDEDGYVRKALTELSLMRIIELVDGKQDPTVDEIVSLGKEAMKRNHPTLYEQLMREEAEASTRLDGDTIVIEGTEQDNG